MLANFVNPRMKAWRALGVMLQQVHVIEQGVILRRSNDTSPGFILTYWEDAHGPK